MTSMVGRIELGNTRIVLKDILCTYVKFFILINTIKTSVLFNQIRRFENKMKENNIEWSQENANKQCRFIFIYKQVKFEDEYLFHIFIKTDIISVELFSTIILLSTVTRWQSYWLLKIGIFCFCFSSVKIHLSPFNMVSFCLLIIQLRRIMKWSLKKKTKLFYIVHFTILFYLWIKIFINMNTRNESVYQTIV